MAKILIIENCDQCPHLYKGGRHCNLTDKENVFVPNIPSWCPLCDVGEEDEIL